MFLPQKPYKGNQVLKWAQKATEYMQSITPRSSNRIKVNRTPVGTTFSEKPDFYVEPYHFQVIADPDYSPIGTDRRLAIRGGFARRAAWSVNEFQITDPLGASPDFAAAGGAAIDDLAIASALIADGEVWLVYLGLWNDTISDWSSVDPTDLVAKVNAGTIVSPPSRPTEPETDNVQNWSRVLCKVTNNEGKLTYDQEWKGGNIKDFELQTDTNAPIEVTPRLESLDYITDGGSAGELIGLLQDRQANELIVEDDTLADTDDDQIMSWFLYSHAGITKKYYARIDTENAGTHNDCGESLHINANNIFELRQFTSALDGILAPTGNPYSFFLDKSSCIRDDSGAIPILRYANLTDLFNWAYESDWDELSINAPIVDGADGQLNDYSNRGIYSGTIEYLVVTESGPAGEVWYADARTAGEWIDIFHDETDPTLGTDPFADIEWEANPDHDDRYWPAFGAAERGGGTYGVDGKSFHTTGEMHAADIYVQDAPTNHWGDDELRVQVNSVYIEADAGTLEIETSAANNIIIDSGATIDIDAAGSVDMDAAVDVDMAAGANMILDVGAVLDIDTVGDIDAYTTTGDILLESGAGDVNITAKNNALITAELGVDVVSSLADVTLDAETFILADALTYIELIAGTYLDLDPTGELRINGAPGQTIANWTTKGPITGGTVVEFAARLIPAGGGAPIDQYVLTRPYP